MTSAILPEFVLRLLEKEVSDVVLQAVRYVCNEYNIPFSEVCTKLGKHLCIELDVNTQTNFKVVKKNVRRIKATPENQCIANILCKDQKDIRQCTIRRTSPDCEYCTKHKMAFDQNKLKYGTVFKPVRP